LLLVLRLETSGMGSPVLPIALLIVGSNGIIAILLPYAGESVPARRPGPRNWLECSLYKGRSSSRTGLEHRGTGSSNRGGRRDDMVPAAFSLLLVMLLGQETRGQDLRDLETS
jgi:putative MFS transporter